MRSNVKKCLNLAILFAALAEIGFVSMLKADEKKDPTEVRLQSILSKSLPKLGDLEPWQKVIFHDEVLAQPQRFVRNYQMSSTGSGPVKAQEQDFKADIDLENILSYLKFHASKSSAGQNAKAVFILKPDPACAACTRSLPSIRTWVRSRLEKRGFHAEDLGSENSSSLMIGASWEDSLDSIGKSKNAQWVALVRWAPVPPEDLDSAHADEKVYSLTVSFRVLGADSVTVKKTKEVLDLESFDVSLGRVWTDAMTELGSKWVADETRQSSLNHKESYIEVSGKLDFQQYKKVKASLESQLKGVGSLEERFISQNHFVFAISTQKSPEDLRSLLSQLSAETGVGRLFEWKVQ
jgi:hypothetical protein